MNRLFQVDAFTTDPFAGNPAAVCLLSAIPDDLWMQKMAREMNMSETAFVLKQAEGFLLRWFTPVTEVELCGHATLASAHILWEIDLLKATEPARFSTRSGLLSAERREELIELTFPRLEERPATLPEGVEAALGIRPKYVGQFGAKYLVEVDNEETVRNLRPDFQALRKIPGRGVVVTSRASSASYDIVSRYFAPWVGVDEDPVTGSVHCCLGPFWSKRLKKQELVAYQASARGGVIHLRVADERVYLGGAAVTVFGGELRV